MHIYSNDVFDFEIFNNYYKNIYENYNLLDSEKFIGDYNFDFINKEDEKFKNLILETSSSFSEMLKINKLLNDYNKNIYPIILNLIKIDFSDITNTNMLKKIIGTYFFKKENYKLCHSKLKKIKDIFHKREKKLKEINEKYIFENIELDEIDYIYNTDKIISSGEKKVLEILLKLYKTRNEVIFFFHEYVLPIKREKNLRCDFYILIKGSKSIRKVIIEVNGSQHYKMNVFFNDKSLEERDKMKKKYSEKNDIIYLEVTYDKIISFQKNFLDLLLE